MGARHLHSFKLIALGDTANRGWFRAYRSSKYPTLEVWLFGSRRDREVVRQYRIDGYDTVNTPVESLTEAVRICRQTVICPACGPLYEPCEHVPTASDFL